ncbi:MAG TPA: SDR family oxidoreductase [Chryseosolibacter sp.]|nr:SDR family oxidoreductase [Chryseosolibacter sp.]
MTRLKDKVIWLTGASSGIGEALAYALAETGARLILSSRRKEALERVKGNCPSDVQPRVRTLPLDLEKPDMLRLSVEAAIQMFGQIDILINNAGITQRSLAAETSLAVDRKLMEINYFGPVALIKYLLPHFIRRKHGHIVNITSLTGKFGTPYRSGYAASKHALHGFSDALRAEHFKDNIRVTMICPGFIRTNLTLSALTADGSPLNKMDEAQYKGKSAQWCAGKIVSAIEKEKQEVYIGGREVFAVYIKKFFPEIFSNIIRRVAVR